MSDRIDLTPSDDRPPADPDDAQRHADELADELLADQPPPWDDTAPDDDPWLDDAPEVTPDQVAGWLRTFGAGANLVLPGRRLVPDAWRFTEAEIGELAPPLARIVNRRPQLRALAARSDADAFAVALGMGRYGWRNYSELREAAAVAEAATDDLLSAHHDTDTDTDDEPTDPATWPGVTGG